jgi:hypothetical protein
VPAAIDVTLLSRYYERYADHAVTIARRVVHVVTGTPYSETSWINAGPDALAAHPEVRSGYFGTATGSAGSAGPREVDQ